MIPPEITALLVIAALAIIYFIVEPRLRPHRICQMLLAGILGMAFAYIMAAPIFAYWPLTMEKLMLMEPHDGAHVLTYLMIGGVFFYALATAHWQKPLIAALTAALFISIHEGGYFAIYYGAHPWLLLTQNWLLGDIATGFRYLTVCIIYAVKRYRPTSTLYYGAAFYLALEIMRYAWLGPYAKPETLFTAAIGELSWTFMFCIVLWHIRSARKARS